MFKKYSSIENHYQNKYIQRFLECHPELKDVQYTIEHKIDGANISILVDEENGVRWAKRSCVIANDDNFMGLSQIKDDYQQTIDNIIEYKNKYGISTIQLYGEIFGPGIQKRINYGDIKRIQFFDVRINGIYLAPFEFYQFINIIDWKRQIRVIKIVNSLEKALNHSTRIYTEQGSLIEGIVVKPYLLNYYSPVGDRFVLKIKNDEYKEKEKTKKKGVVKNHRPEVEEARQEFESLVNENRVLSVFSKEGEIEDTKDIGKYIKLVLEDAKEDFFKENSIDGFTKDEEKYTFNVSGQIVPILRKYL